MKLQHDLHFIQFLQFNGHGTWCKITPRGSHPGLKETRIPVRGEVFLFLLGSGAAAGGRGRAQRRAGKGGAGAGQQRPAAGRTH